MKVSIKGAVWTQISTYTNARLFTFAQWEQGGDWVKLCDHTIEMDLPTTEDSLIQQQVAGMKEKMAKIDAEAYKEKMEVQEHINKLTAIGYTPAADGP